MSTRLRICRERSASEAMVRLMYKAVKKLKDKCPARVRVAFEWPRHCDGWSIRVLQPLLALLPYVGDFDGCAVGLTGLSGRPHLKKWRVVTDHPGLAVALARHRCAGRHQHEPLRGDRAYRSGFYTPRLADIVVRSFLEQMPAGKQAVLEVSQRCPMENEPAAPQGDPAGEDEPGDRARLEHYVRKPVSYTHLTLPTKRIV